MTDRQAQAVLRRFIDGFTSKQKAADSLGVSRQFLHDVLHGRRKLSPKLLAKLGLARDVRIVEAK